MFDSIKLRDGDYVCEIPESGIEVESGGSMAGVVFTVARFSECGVEEIGRDRLKLLLFRSVRDELIEALLAHQAEHPSDPVLS